MISDFYAIISCDTGHILVLVCLGQKINAIKFDSRDDFNSRFADFLKQLDQDSESIQKATYGWRYCLN